MDVTLYARPGCTLCTELRRDLDEFQAALNFTLVERNIEDDPADLARFALLIPVLEIDNGPLLYPPHHWDELDATLRAASRAAQARALESPA